MDSNVTASSRKQVGRRPVRHDGVEKVTGHARYGADVRLPGMLHAKVLRSPHAHARLLSVDTSRAEAHPDVRAVVTASDMPELDPDAAADVQLRHMRDTALARDKVLFAGHGIAAVAAATPHAAEEALNLIDVQYEVLPAVTNVEDAMSPDAPVLHADLGVDVAPGPNLCAHGVHSLGDVEAGFAEADLIVEREFRTSTVHQGYVEPQTATAAWSADGRLTVWCSSQGHFRIRDEVARVLAMPVSRVTVVPMEIGGGFGGKLRAYVEPIAALLSRKAGRPVKLTMTRAEVFQATGPTCGSYVRVKMGAAADGRLTAAQAFLVYESGAYPTGQGAAQSGVVFTPYHIPNQRGEGFDVVDNKPTTEAYRAPGAPMVSLAAETVIDEIARELRIDPAELRLINAASADSRKTNGTPYGHMGLRETLEAVRAHPHYSAPMAGENVGRGVAIGFWGNGAGPAAAVASVVDDGTVHLLIGAVDIGGLRTVTAQQLADTLGIPVEDVNPHIGDTDAIGYTSSTSGSSTAFKLGYAAYEAGLDVRRQLVERAARIWDAPADEVEYRDGVLQRRGRPDQRLTFKEAAAMLADTGGPIVGRANVTARGQAPGISANIVDVEVDPETGKVDVTRLTAFQDAGVAVHPSYVEGQDPGRGGAGRRLGAQRGVLHERLRSDAQHESARLPDADRARPAAHRRRGDRGAQRGPPVRLAGRRRGQHHPAARGHSQRRPRRRGRPHAPPAHDPRLGPEGDPGEGEPLRRVAAGGCCWRLLGPLAGCMLDGMRLNHVAFG